MKKELVRRERERLGKFLQKKRMEKGLSQGEVAKKLGYTSPQFISNIERGLCSPALSSAKKMAKLYDIYPANMQAALASVEVAKISEAFQ